MASIKYEKKTDIQHVLDCSDMYIGATEPHPRKEYIYDSDSRKIVSRHVNIPEALVRIFVETLTNAIDNAERSKTSDTPCKTIKISVDMSTGKTSVWNDGQIIPINQDNGDGIYNHSLIFGHFRTGSNYAKDECRELSGKNGIGVKCTNIFSSIFEVVGVDPESCLRLKQVWTENMRVTNGPVVTDARTRDGFTRVRYVPDFARFAGCAGYPPDALQMFHKFAVDTAVMLPDVDIWFNGKQVKCSSMADYGKLYYSEQDAYRVLHLRSDKADVAVFGSAHARAPISFVNGQITKDGGTHTAAWVALVLSKVTDRVNKKRVDKCSKKDVSPCFQFFVHARVDKPKFDGQNKNKLVHPPVSAEISESQVKKMLKWPVLAGLRDRLDQKALLSLRQIEGPRNKKPVLNIDGYDSANTLGSRSVLIVCEGLSAKSYAMAGIPNGISSIGKKGREHFGILPLRGKFLNVQNANPTKIKENKIVSDLIKVLGLRFNVDYTNKKIYNSLNYGTLLILTDADKDGIHIEGLIINFFTHLFPSLAARKGFILSMKTPIAKILNENLLFFSEQTFEEYRDSHPDTKNFKYYKGLGSNTKKDVEDSFGLKLVQYRIDADSKSFVDKVFSDEQADERKSWLAKFDPTEKTWLNLDKHAEPIIDVNVRDFMDKEMIKYSYEDCKRSLANVVDGFKESQRKVIFAIRDKFKHESDSFKTKVAQLGGSVAERTDYKHGEQNLSDTIVKFAQDFVGTNNVPLLFPDGQFGSRVHGGKDAANPRYIETKPQPILKFLIRKEDDPILQHSVEGEPVFFVPIIPIVLVNGTTGIGTGWSSFVPQYDPKTLVRHIKHALIKESSSLSIPKSEEPIPYYRGFTGKIVSVGSGKFLTTGTANWIASQTLRVTELPIGMWTYNFKHHCSTLLHNNRIQTLVDNSNTTIVDMTISGIADPAILKLNTTLHTTNMVLFTAKNKIKKYNSVRKICKEHYRVRLDYYARRKQHDIRTLVAEIESREEKLRFIKMVVEEPDFLKQPDRVILEQLEERNFTGSGLLNLPISNFTQDKILKLQTRVADLNTHRDTLERTSVHQLWLHELEELEANL